MARKIYQYYVEGDDEKVLINSLKSELRCIVPGKVEVFNVVQNAFTVARLRTLEADTTIVLVYDTDIDMVDILKNNIRFLKEHNAVKEILCIPQVENLEDVLIDSCGIDKVTEITHSKTKTDFKRDIIRCTNLGSRLKACEFDKNKLWEKMPNNKFKEFGNDSNKIKFK